MANDVDSARVGERKVATEPKRKTEIETERERREKKRQPAQWMAVVGGRGNQHMLIHELIAARSLSTFALEK